MRVTKVFATSGVRAREEPVQDALQWLDTQGTCHVTVETDQGVSGSSSIAFGRGAAAPGVLARLINDELAPVVVGEDPFLIRGVRDRLWRETDYHGTVGLALFGIAGIDLALWDFIGRALDQPVWRLLGAHRETVPAYVMVGWLNYDLDTLKSRVTRALEQGFRSIKMKVGAATLDEDVARIRAVRSVMDDAHLLMVDANQVLSVQEALRRGRVFKELRCFWFEEPIRADDVDGLAHLAHQLDIPIAAGENTYGLAQFRQMFERRAVDIVQPDIRRAGGLTECLEIGLTAHSFNLPYASHGGGAHLHLLAALPNTIYMESGLLDDDNDIVLVDGCYPLPETPGLG
jgi:L-alanine-DL-glutamate epimerase-like enolase superfamily enzyme